MYKKKKDKNKILLFILIPVLVIILLFMSLNKNRYVSSVESILKDTTTFIQKVLLIPSTKPFNKEKNIIQKNVNESLEKEIQDLKAQLELNKTITEYTPENATILSRNKSYWFNTITIDKGKKDGIKNEMAVITKYGLIGKIEKVSNHSSEVKLITTEDINFKVSISIKTNNTDNFAILNGYDKETGLIKATGIDKTTAVNVGDEVLTSGLGSMFPQGI